MLDEVDEYVKKRIAASKVLQAAYDKMRVRGVDPKFPSIEKAKRDMDAYENYHNPPPPDMTGWRHQGERYFTGKIAKYAPYHNSGEIVMDAGNTWVTFKNNNGISFREFCDNPYFDGNPLHREFFFREHKYGLNSILKFKVNGIEEPMEAFDISVITEAEALAMNTTYRVHLASDPSKFVDVSVEPLLSVYEERQAAAERTALELVDNGSGILPPSVKVVVDGEYFDVAITQHVTVKAKTSGRKK